MDMNQLYSDIILEHNQNPENKRELNPFNLEEHGHNPSCGDDITLRADIQDGVVADAAYTGHGCAISQASADIMADSQAILKLYERYVRWDNVLRLYYLELPLEDGIVKIWFEDEKSLKEKAGLMRQYNLAGAAFWRKGFETSNLWQDFGKHE